MRLPDHNLNPPDYDDERNDYIVESLRIDFDEEFVVDHFYPNADYCDLLLKLAKDEITGDEFKVRLQEVYESAFSAYLDENYQKKVDDVNDPY